jgi:chemotaxis protein MotB
MSRRAKQEASSEADERWVISYADLVTLLFGFFLLLYATADANVVKFEKLSQGLSEAFHVPVKSAAAGGGLFDGGNGIVPGGSVTVDINRDLQFIRSIVDKQSALAGVSGSIIVNKESDHIVIRMADQLIFPSASADLRTQALPLLDIVANAVRDLPNEIRVEGHTDNVPVNTAKYPTNWELSSARATAVLRYLVEHAGVDPTHVFAAGYGEERPIATNLTPEGRALNRRADIVVLYPSAKIPTGASSDAAPADGTPVSVAPNLGSETGIAPLAGTSAAGTSQQQQGAPQ